MSRLSEYLSKYSIITPPEHGYLHAHPKKGMNNSNKPMLVEKLTDEIEDKEEYDMKAYNRINRYILSKEDLDHVLIVGSPEWKAMKKKDKKELLKVGAKMNIFARLEKYLIESARGVNEETWKAMSQAEKRKYIKDHPNSRYAKQTTTKEAPAPKKQELTPEKLANEPPRWITTDEDKALWKDIVTRGKHKDYAGATVHFKNHMKKAGTPLVELPKVSKNPSYEEIADKPPRWITTDQQKKIWKDLVIKHHHSDYGGATAHYKNHIRKHGIAARLEGFIAELLHKE